MDQDTLITTLELTPKSSLGFALSTYKGKKYASITKFVIPTSGDPKPIGGLTLDVGKFTEMVKIIEKHFEELLDPTEKLVGTIPLKQGECLRIGVSVYEGVSGIDLRKFLLIEDVWTPTRKGVRIPVEEADSLDESLREVLEAIK